MRIRSERRIGTINSPLLESRGTQTTSSFYEYSGVVDTRRFAVRAEAG